MSERHRLIRYTTLATDERPNLLSMFDEDRQLQRIDRNLVQSLPREMQNRLEMSSIPMTMVIDDGMGLRFGEWVAPK